MRESCEARLIWFLDQRARGHARVRFRHGLERRSGSTVPRNQSTNIHLVMIIVIDEIVRSCDPPGVVGKGPGLCRWSSRWHPCACLDVAQWDCIPHVSFACGRRPTDHAISRLSAVCPAVYPARISDAIDELVVQMPDGPPGS